MHSFSLTLTHSHSLTLSPSFSHSLAHLLVLARIGIIEGYYNARYRRQSRSKNKARRKSRTRELSTILSNHCHIMTKIIRHADTIVRRYRCPYKKGLNEGSYGIKKFNKLPLALFYTSIHRIFIAMVLRAEFSLTQ